MGKSKRSAVRALDWLVQRGVEVPAVVAPEPDPALHDSQRLDLAAQRHGLALMTEDELYAAPPNDVDVVVSFLFWNLIRQPLLSLGSVGCLNFHPAPLPDYRGIGGDKKGGLPGGGGGGGGWPLLAGGLAPPGPPPGGGGAARGGGPAGGFSGPQNHEELLPAVL